MATDYTYLAATVADGAKQPVQSDESLTSIAQRSVIEANGPLIVGNPDYSQIVTDTANQIKDNQDGQLGN